MSTPLPMTFGDKAARGWVPGAMTMEIEIQIFFCGRARWWIIRLHHVSTIQLYADYISHPSI